MMRHEALSLDMISKPMIIQNTYSGLQTQLNRYLHCSRLTRFSGFSWFYRSSDRERAPAPPPATQPPSLKQYNKQTIQRYSYREYPSFFNIIHPPSRVEKSTSPSCAYYRSLQQDARAEQDQLCNTSPPKLATMFTRATRLTIAKRNPSDHEPQSSLGIR